MTKIETEMLAALKACVEYWRDSDVPCSPELHDQVTTAIFNADHNAFPERL